MPLGIVECVLHVGKTGSERPQFMYMVNVDTGSIDKVELLDGASGAIPRIGRVLA